MVYVGRIKAARWKTEHAGDFAPLVSESVFLQVQARLSAQGRDKGRVADDPRLPLRRFLRCARCDTPLTGSYSTGRSKKYPYYHCRRGCKGISARANVVEMTFAALLQGLQPRPEYLRLFNAVVLDAWKTERAHAEEMRAAYEQRAEDVRRNLQRVEDAFLIDRSIDERSYWDMRDRLREQLALAEMTATEARNEHLDVEGVLAFAEHVLGNAAALWANASPANRRQLQTALFPKGLSWGPDGFGTAVTSSAFSLFEVSKVGKSRVASPPGFEPGFQP
ncbi:MAG: hypothetical protein FJW23_08670 [Acidimicrobiia bacterium]|nr:hypothetical protein [Acidimicrobiia bacterium]